MSKKTGLWLMVIGAAASLYDAVAGGNPLYGPGKPLESMRWKVYTTGSGKNYYVSITDLAIVAGAWIYFGRKG